MDIAGLVAGASKGEGLGNKFLATIRETDGIINMVRCFVNDNVVHVAGNVDPISDIETIQTELALADLATVEKALQRETKLAKSGNKEAIKFVALLETVHAHLDQGKPARSLGLDKEQQQLLKPLCLLTAKPAIYVANIDEIGFTDNPLLDASGGICRPRGRAGGADLRGPGSGNCRDAGRGQADFSRRHEPGRTGAESADPRRLPTARPANLFHSRA